jgi:signal transduction histidine kinase
MTDQRMPGMTGVEFLHRVRGAYPEAVRLLFTGYADIKAVVDAINQGNVYRYITKPWDPDELQAVIRQAADQYDLLVERRQLLSELQAKNQDLEQANDRLRQANELKEAFIRVASHELRTPITILMGLTELSLKTPGLGGPLADWLQHIHRASGRLNHLTNQLVQMLAAGRFEPVVARQPTDLAALVREAADEVRPFIEKRRQDLRLDLAPDLGSLPLDPDKVRDAVAHLLLNAIKFTPDGGQVRVAACRLPDGGAEIRVSDTGTGIAADCLPHVFEPFFTARDVSRHSSGHFEFGKRGLGLGLALVKGFVEMHGGRVTVSSAPGQGTTFVVTLPAPADGPAVGEYHL